jgi:hypothetical protein
MADLLCRSIGWIPLVNLFVIPLGVFLLTGAVNAALLHYPSERVWKIAAMSSFLLLALSYAGLGVVFEQCRGR